MHKVIKNIFYFILSLFPKKNNKIVLESHPDYTDSAKAMFDYLTKYGKREYKFVWLVDNPDKYKNLGLKNAKFISINKSTSLKYIYNIATSKYLMFGNREIRWVDLKHQTVIHFTHGLPFKTSKGLLPTDKTFNYLLCSSDKTVPIMADEFNTTTDKCFVCGLPRNDVLFEKNDLVETFVNKYDKFILWLPTYRKHKDANIINSVKYKDKVIPLFNEKELVALNTSLKEKNILLMLKFHPAQDLSMLHNVELSNILLWKNDDLENHHFNLYSLMAYADALITDYSSVGADYLLLNRPLAYVRDDIDEFTDSRGFCIDDVDAMSPGNKINNKTDFIKFIDEISNNMDKYKVQRQKVINFYHKYQDGTTCKVLSDHFKL